MNEAAAMARSIRHALDPAAWATDVLGIIPDPWQARMMRTPADRVLLCCSRQSGKSTSTAALAAHTAIFAPGSLILMVSRAQRQSQELFRKTAGFLKLARQQMPVENAASCELANGSRVHALPGDRGGSLRGFSAPALVVFDEAAFCLDEVYQACRPMLAVSGGRLMLLSTPHGKQGFYYHAWTSETETWHRESVPADECPRITAEFLSREREVIGENWFKQEYLCEFIAASEQLFSEDSILRAFNVPAEPLFIN